MSGIVGEYVKGSSLDPGIALGGIARNPGKFHDIELLRLQVLTGVVQPDALVEESAIKSKRNGR
jgi:hypothetical protein